jgi:aminoglycoside phosphotransferase (APT) family kinase protein
MSYENNIMRAEVDALRLVKANTEVPVPEVYFYDDTHSICSSDYFFMEKLTGESFSRMRFSGSMPEEDQNRILYAVGHYNKEINTVHGSCFGYIGQNEKQGLNWKKTFLAMIADVLTDGEKIKISLGIPYDEVRDLVDKASFALEQVTVPQLVHWDLWEGNVFVKDGGISGIIDLERALWGDPLMEYFFRLHSYNPSFVKGYGRDLREEAPVRALLYDIYLYLIMVIETKYRNYPDDWQYQFASKNLKIVIDKLRELL